MRSHLPVFLISLMLGVGCATAPAAPDTALQVEAWPGEEGANTAPEAPNTEAGRRVVQALSRYKDIEHGVGAEHRAKVALAVELAREERQEEAHTLLDSVLHAFHGSMVDRSAIYISVANAQEFALFRRLVPEDRDVIWLDWSFREALHAKAFMAVGEHDFEQAMEFLDVEATFAPFAASAHCERGYILNHLKRPVDGLEAYKTALDLAMRFSSSGPDAPVALRGIGFSLVELGDLDGAAEAYRQSLKLQPDHPLAQEELDYIEKLRKKGAAPGAQP